MSDAAATVLRRAAELRGSLGVNFRDAAVQSIYAEATRIAGRATHEGAGARAN